MEAHAIKLSEHKMAMVYWRYDWGQWKELNDQWLQGQGNNDSWYAPVEPERPVEPYLPQQWYHTFRLPEVIQGRLFLRKLGFSKDHRAQLLRTAGSWKLSALEPIVKMSEQEQDQTQKVSFCGEKNMCFIFSL